MNNPIEAIGQRIKNWWVPVLIGVLLILMAIYVMANPVGSLLGLAMFFSIMLIASGLASMAFAWVNRNVMTGWGWNFGGGILELLLGVVLLNRPGATMAILTLLLGFWLIFRSAYGISMAFEMRDYRIKNWGMVLVGGIITGILALCVIFDPFAGAVVISIWIGLALLTSGMFTIFIGFTLRRIKLRINDAKDRVHDALAQ